MIDRVFILKELQKFKKFDKNKEFAEFLGIKETRLSMWFSRNVYDIDIMLEKFPEISIEWLVTGKGVMLKSQNLNSISEPSPDPTPVVQPSAEVPVGQKTVCSTGKILPLNLRNINTSIEEYAKQNELLDYCPCEHITPFTFAYQIQSDALYPDYNVGDWILIKKIDFSEVRIGKTYFIDTRSKGKMIKRVDYNNNALILSLPKRPWLCPILNIDKNDILSEIYGIYDIIFQLRKTDELPPTHENNDLVKQNADFIELAKTAMHNQEKTLGLLQDTIEMIKRKF